MITLNDFVNSDANEQVEILKRQGVQVGKRDYGHYIVHLFQIDSFYAEIFYRKIDFSIWKVGGFDHQVLLTPYLEKINIDNLGLT